MAPKGVKWRFLAGEWGESGVRVCFWGCNASRSGDFGKNKMHNCGDASLMADFSEKEMHMKTAMHRKRAVMRAIRCISDEQCILQRAIL